MKQKLPLTQLPIGNPKPKRGKKATERRKAKLEADKWCRAYCKARWKSCVTCGSTENLQWAHLFTAHAESTRWHSWNCNVQCAGCNLRHEHDPSPYLLWFLRTKGLEKYEILTRLHHTPAKYKVADLIEIAEAYKSVYKSEVENER